MSLFTTDRKTIFVTLLTIVIILTVIGMGTLQYHSVSDYRMLGETKVLVSDIESNVLTLRRNEKDFLARKDLLYHQRFVDNFKLILANVEKLRSDLQRNGIEDPKLDQLDAILDDYQNQFLTIVDLQRTVGFHHEDGLYGAMRKAIHRVEKILDALQQNRLLKDMLMLRRHEKDFMLRKDIRYTKKFEDDMVVMQSDLSRAYIDPRAKRDIAIELAAYQRDFEALVSATREMGFNGNDGLYGEMRQRINQSEDILSQLRQEVLLLESNAGSRMLNQIIISAIVLTLLIGAVIRL